MKVVPDVREMHRNIHSKYTLSINIAIQRYHGIQLTKYSDEVVHFKGDNVNMQLWNASYLPTHEQTEETHKAQLVL